MSKPALIRYGIILGLIALWFLVTAMEWVKPMQLPPPSGLWAAWQSDGSRFLDAFALTAAEIAAAIVIAWPLGIVIGAFFGTLRAASMAESAILGSLFAVPAIILYPLFIAWVGMGPESKVLFGVIAGFFPIALNTLSGVRQVDQNYVTMARAMGANRLQTFYRVVLRLALPSVISGLRIGTALIMISVVVSEMLASFGGLGYMIAYHRTMFDTGHVYLGILMALLTVLTVNWLLSRLESHFSKWQVRGADL